MPKDSCIQKKILNEQRIGELLIEERIITESQINEALNIQKNLEHYKPIGQILIDQKAVTKKHLELILKRYKKELQLGSVLLKSGFLTKEQLEHALEYQKESGLRFGEILLKLNFVTDEIMRQALCYQLNIPFIDLNRIILDRNLIKIINKNFAFKHNIVPISKIGRTLTLAMNDPTNVMLVEEIQAFTELNVNIITSTQSDIQNALIKLYDYNDVYIKKENKKIEFIEDTHLKKESTYIKSITNSKATNILQEIISVALNNNVTDIHIETHDNKIDVRFRTDGVLQKFNLGRIENEINENMCEIISRIKILGQLDIAERRRPQDGSFRVRIQKNDQLVNLDCRISIIPGYYGENAVIRILDPRNAPQSIQQLNFSKKITEPLSQLLRRNTGIILVTGPTGSGKSTTLYAALSTAYRPGIKILTAEDPIEYVYEKISQFEVNERIGNTFACYLRAFLRHDPEVILVGEIRDNETADMAFRAAQTGHLILSTLHTNDAVSTVMRLHSLDIDPNLITSCLMGVLSQRLVRKVCSKCKEEYVPSMELMNEFFNGYAIEIKWQKGRGCNYCNFTGYKGRTAIAELWIPNQEDIIIINKGTNLDKLKNSSVKTTISMAEDAMKKLLKGETNLEELARTLPSSSIYQFRNMEMHSNQ